ncbi:MAG: hypothetical protein SFX74_05325 [Fimbriimonadaceae bacterium]|nr:hypothetical protein [Fimbriimonadaceae bacterium]
MMTDCTRQDRAVRAMYLARWVGDYRSSDQDGSKYLFSYPDRMDSVTRQTSASQGSAENGNDEGIDPGDPIPDGALEILNDDLPGQMWFNKLNHIGGEIQAAEYHYNPFTTNSHAFTFTTLRRSGLLDHYARAGAETGNWVVNPDSGQGAPWAPGWGIVLGRR